MCIQPELRTRIMTSVWYCALKHSWRNFSLKTHKIMQICFYILENKLNFGSKVPVPISIITTLLENKVAKHFISDIKSLFATYDISVEIKADNISWLLRM